MEFKVEELTLTLSNLYLPTIKTELIFESQEEALEFQNFLLQGKFDIISSLDLQKIKELENIPSFPVPTPKLEQAIKIIKEKANENNNCRITEY